MRHRLADVLSELEVQVLTLYVQGKSYQEIGDHIGRHVKSIDNALQRIKRKLDVHLSERADADRRSEEHTSEIQSLMRITSTVVCMKKKTKKHNDKKIAK